MREHGAKGRIDRNRCQIIEQEERRTLLPSAAPASPSAAPLAQESPAQTVANGTLSCPPSPATHRALHEHRRAHLQAIRAQQEHLLTLARQVGG